MKFKKQNRHPIFPPSSIMSNIDHIRDTEIGHVDLSQFLKRVEQPSSYNKIESIIDSSIHLMVAFPMSAQDLEFVIAQLQTDLI